MKRRLDTMALVILVCGIVLFIAGFNIGRSGAVDAQNARYYKTLSSPPTSQEKLIFLEYARDSHQFYVDHPELSNNFTGTPEDNIRWVRLYEAIIPDYK